MSSKAHDLHVQIRDLALKQIKATGELNVEKWLADSLKIKGAVVGSVGYVHQALRVMELIPVNSLSPWAVDAQAKKKAKAGTAKKPAAKVSTTTKSRSTTKPQHKAA